MYARLLCAVKRSPCIQLPADRNLPTVMTMKSRFRNCYRQHSEDLICLCRYLWLILRPLEKGCCMCEDKRLDKVAYFLAWCTQRGITYPKCDISQFDNTGRGVGATDDIDANEVILNVPDDAVLMPETCSLAEVNTSLQQYSYTFSERQEGEKKPIEHVNWEALASLHCRCKPLIDHVQELREAQLFNGSSRGRHAELSGLTIALMYEASIGQASRSAAVFNVSMPQFLLK